MPVWRGALTFLLLALVACAPQVQQGVASPVPKEKELSYYTKEVKPLEPEECGRCHYQIYQSLKDSGAKHRGVLCTQCHREYHVYSPKKKNWAQIMPKCQTCHKLPHGESVTQCGECHVNPHAPKNIPLVTIESKCVQCHPGPVAELKSCPSKHTEVGCTGCHENRHGYVPDCSVCHEPHVPGQRMAECLACHPVHSPTRISYAVNTPNQVCGACHEGPYEHLKERITKHSALTCAKCHPQHGKILACSECHGKPHGAALHKRFPKCVQCHIDPHYLPVKKVKSEK